MVALVVLVQHAAFKGIVPSMVPLDNTAVMRCLVRQALLAAFKVIAHHMAQQGNTAEMLCLVRQDLVAAPLATARPMEQRDNIAAMESLVPRDSTATGRVTVLKFGIGSIRTECSFLLSIFSFIKQR